MRLPVELDIDREAEETVVARMLAVLAQAFVTSEEVNYRWEEALGVFGTAEFPDLAALVVRLEDAGKPFELRPLGIQGLDQVKLRERLPDFLRVALGAAARIVVASASNLERVEEATDALGTGNQAASEDDAFLAEECQGLGILEQSSVASPAEFLDPLASRGDLSSACASISEDVESARRRFVAIQAWHGAKIDRALAQRFGRALDLAVDCIRRISEAPPSPALVASDVYDGVVAAFGAVDLALPKLPGAISAAEILTRIILELAGLVPDSLERDDSARHEYVRKARSRASTVYAPRVGRVPDHQY